MENYQKNRLFTIFIPFIFILFISRQPCSYAEEISVIPCGEAVGIKIYTDGLLVVGTTHVQREDGSTVYPARKYNIKTNDLLLKADNIPLKTIEQFGEIVQKCSNGVKLSVKRNEEYFETVAVPAVSKNGQTQLGLWIRDSTAGIGTVTYINPADNSFAALGHGVCDIDTGNILSVKSGNILNCSLLSVIKSKHGSPGELSGVFDKPNIGEILKNNQCGIFGKISDLNAFSCSDAVPVANISQVETGNAYILSDIDGNGAKKYDINITKLSKNNNDKCIIFEVTDNALKEKAGGIVQGMSGSPIIQNDCLVGAVTHVFVNDPEKGYGVFAQSMFNSFYD